MSAATKDTTATKPAGLTDRDIETLIKVFKCFKATPEIDFEKMSNECELSNKKHASTVWYRLKKKMFPDGMPAAETDDGAAEAAAKPNSGKKRQTAIKKSNPAAKPDDAVSTDGGDDGKDTETKDGATTPDVGSTTPVPKSGAEANGDNAADNKDEDDAASQGTPAKRRRRANATNGSPKAAKAPRAPRTPRAPKTPKSPKAVKEAKEARAKTSRAGAKKTPKSAATANDDDTDADATVGGTANAVLAQVATLAAAVPKDAVPSDGDASGEVKDSVMADSAAVIEGVV